MFLVTLSFLAPYMKVKQIIIALCYLIPMSHHKIEFNMIHVHKIED